MSVHDSTAAVHWTGDRDTGRGSLTTGSGTIEAEPVCFSTRIGGSPRGTTPEELLAAAYASCYAMELTQRLEKAGFSGGTLDATARCVLEQHEFGGLEIRDLYLEVSGDVPGISESRFVEYAEKAESHCPMNRALFGNVNLHLDARLTAHHLAVH